MGDIVFIKRLSDKQLSSGFSMKRYDVRRPGAPGSDDVDANGVDGCVVYDPQTRVIPY